MYKTVKEFVSLLETNRKKTFGKYKKSAYDTNGNPIAISKVSPIFIKLGNAIAGYEHELSKMDYDVRSKDPDVNAIPLEAVLRDRDQAVTALGDIYASYRESEEFTTAFVSYCNFYVLTAMYRRFDDPFFGLGPVYKKMPVRSVEYYEHIRSGIDKSDREEFTAAREMDGFGYGMPLVYSYIYNSLSLRLSTIDPKEAVLARSEMDNIFNILPTELHVCLGRIEPKGKNYLEMNFSPYYTAKHCYLPCIITADNTRLLAESITEDHDLLTRINENQKITNADMLLKTLVFSKDKQKENDLLRTATSKLITNFQLMKMKLLKEELSAEPETDDDIKYLLYTWDAPIKQAEADDYGPIEAFERREILFLPLLITPDTERYIMGSAPLPVIYDLNKKAERLKRENLKLKKENRRCKTIIKHFQKELKSMAYDPEEKTGSPKSNTEQILANAEPTEKINESRDQHDMADFSHTVSNTKRSVPKSNTHDAESDAPTADTDNISKQYSAYENISKESIEKQKRLDMVKDFSHTVNNIIEPAILKKIAQKILSGEDVSDLVPAAMDSYVSMLTIKNECALLRLIHDDGSAKQAISNEIRSCIPSNDSMADTCSFSDIFSSAMSLIMYRALTGKSARFSYISKNFKEAGIDIGTPDTSRLFDRSFSPKLCRLWKEVFNLDFSVCAELQPKRLFDDQLGTSFMMTRIFELMQNAFTYGKLGPEGSFKFSVTLEEKGLSSYIVFRETNIIGSSDYKSTGYGLSSAEEKMRAANITDRAFKGRFLETKTDGNKYTTAIYFTAKLYIK